MRMIETKKLPVLLTEHEAAVRLRRSIDTIRRERKRGRIGYTCVGARIFYTEDQLAQYLENQRVEPCQEKERTGKDRSGTTGSQYARTAPSCAAPGSIRTPDKHAAHRLAQLTFGKQS